MDSDVVLARLRASTDELAVVAETVDPALQSYADAWTVPQVYGHLGSGAELGRSTVAAAAGDGERLVAEEVWARWNAYPPEQMIRESVIANVAYLDYVDALGAEVRESLRMDIFLGPSPLSTYLAQRLSEVALHSWDIRVAIDPRASVDRESALIVLRVITPHFARLIAKPFSALTPGRVALRTPEFTLGIEIGDGEVTVYEGEPADPTALVELPAEALLRLTAGRLDPAHTPASVMSGGVPTLDDLRVLFPGY